jgi:hypothetical protein
MGGREARVAECTLDLKEKRFSPEGKMNKKQ